MACAKKRKEKQISSDTRKWGAKQKETNYAKGGRRGGGEGGVALKVKKGWRTKSGSRREKCPTEQ